MLELKIREYQSCDRKKWDNFVMEKSMNGTFLQTKGFLDYHGERFKDVSLIIYKGNDTMVAVIPACEIQDQNRRVFHAHCGSTFGGIVIAKDLKTTAIAQGLQSASVEFALDYSCDSSKDAVLASDMPITLHDLNVASQGRIGLIIVPFADREIISQADKYEMAVITTGFTNILY